MRVSLLFLVLSFSQVTFASNSFVGDWCKRYDDFTEAYKITRASDGGLNVSTWTVGNSSGENHGYSRGFISMGASSVVFQLDGYDMGVTDIKQFFSVRLGKKRLRFFYEDGNRITFTACKINYRN